MRKQKPILLFVAAALVLAPAALVSKEHYRALDKPKDFYYGYISFVEAKGDGNDPVVVREGGTEPVQAVVNLPLGPGDVIRTTSERRCEIQFDSATIVRLDVDTELKIETILARSLSSSQELSNLFLSRGRIYVMYKEYNGREMFQILTPAAAVKLKHKSVAMIRASADGSSDVQVKYGKANVLFGKSEAEIDRETVGKAERVIITGDGQSQVAEGIEGTDFELWNEEINRNFEELHEGIAVLPKPIQKLPRAVFHFAQQYGYRYGEWIWEDHYGYVWRPFLNDARYPSGGWQPYFYGQWAFYSGQMFWVPDEPWGWVPYHLGIWHWSKKHGWVWLPGSFFAPAWVDWDFFFGNFCWRPWTLWDWYWGGMYVDSFYGPYGFGYAADDWYYRWPGSPGVSGELMPVQTMLKRGQLKAPPPEAYPVPPEFKSVLKTAGVAYERGETWAVESMKSVPSHLVFVRAENLAASRVGEKALKWDSVPRLKGVPLAKDDGAAPKRTIDPARRAAFVMRGFEDNAEVREMPRRDTVGGLLPKGLASPARTGAVRDATVSDEPKPAPVPRGAARTVTGKSPGRTPSPRSSRFLDWNPDVRIASRLGVGIEYSSRTNEIVSPELRISSRDRSTWSQPVLTSRGAAPSEGGGSGSGSMGRVSSSNPPASGKTGAKEASSGSGGGKAGTVKK
jgi:hypothetical protein